MQKKLDTLSIVWNNTYINSTNEGETKWTPLTPATTAKSSFRFVSKAYATLLGRCTSADSTKAARFFPPTTQRLFRISALKPQTSAKASDRKPRWPRKGSRPQAWKRETSCQTNFKPPSSKNSHGCATSIIMASSTPPSMPRHTLHYQGGFEMIQDSDILGDIFAGIIAAVAVGYFTALILGAIAWKGETKWTTWTTPTRMFPGFTQ